MTTYSYAQLEQLWINNGGSPVTAPIAAAIAEAESGGNDAATNPTDNNGTQTSWGLWQISDGTHAQPVPNILDPNVNAAQAVAKYTAAGGWSPWGTYDSGAYKQYLNGSTTPDANVPTATLTAATSQGSDCLVGPFPHTSWCVLSKSQGRALIGGICAGGGLIVMGVGLAFVMVFALQRSGVAQQVVNMTPAGRALNAAGGAGKAVKRRSSPGADLTPDEVKTANANRRKLAAAKKPSPERAAAMKPAKPKSQVNAPAQGKHAKTGAKAQPKGRHAAAA